MNKITKNEEINILGEMNENLDKRIDALLEKEKSIKEAKLHQENVLHDQLYAKMEKLIPGLQKIFELDRKLNALYFTRGDIETDKCVFMSRDNARSVIFCFYWYWMSVEITENGKIDFSNTENDGVDKRTSYENKLMEAFLNDFPQFKEKAINTLVKSITRREEKVKEELELNTEDALNKDLTKRINALSEKEKSLKDLKLHQESVLHDQLYSKMEALVPGLQKIIELDKKINTLYYYCDGDMEINKCFLEVGYRGVKDAITRSATRRLRLIFKEYWMSVEINEYGEIKFHNTENNGVDKKTSYENKLMKAFLDDYPRFQEKIMDELSKNVKKRTEKVKEEYDNFLKSINDDEKVTENNQKYILVRSIDRWFRQPLLFNNFKDAEKELKKLSKEYKGKYDEFDMHIFKL